MTVGARRVPSAPTCARRSCRLPMRIVDFGSRICRAGFRYTYSMFRYYSRFLLTAGILVCCSGCASTVTSNTTRTAKEQMLLSEAVEQSLSKVDFSPLAGQNVFVEEKYLECVDKAFIVGSIRHLVMRSGGRLMDTRNDADVVMELRSGGVGTDTSEAYVGTPEIALPGMLTIPEIRLAERRGQFGYAKIGMVIYDAKTREVLGDGGMAMAQSDDNNWHIFGVGPIQYGSLKDNVSKARQRVPGMRRRRVPTMITFENRGRSTEAARIQYAGGGLIPSSGEVSQ